ncbi:MAG: hypothetical protein R2728_02870 [Chitinophagales bacterium]
MRAFSKTISAVCHPLLMATWVFILFSNINKYAFGNIDIPKMGIVVLINTFFFPAFCIFLMWRLQFIPNLSMKNKEQRIIPFFAVITCYVWAFMALKQIQAPGFIQLFILGATISVILSFIINIFYRLNLYMVGIGGFIMLLVLFALMGNGSVSNILVVAVVVAGLLGTARVHEEASTLNELYFGLLVGFMGQMIGFVALSSGGFPII